LASLCGFWNFMSNIFDRFFSCVQILAFKINHEILFSQNQLNLPIIMAGEGEKLTGMGKIFNGQTMAGRANVSI
jgi:hypothetical protein